MRIITSASYFATGASAVTDYISEYDSVTSLGRDEYRFLQDPDGVSDLEYNIVENNHRHNTSHAIKRYIQLVKSFKSFGYGGIYKIFGNNFDLLTQEYIQEITELKTKTWWHRDRIDKGEWFCYLDRAYSFLMRWINKVNLIGETNKASILKDREDAFYSAISEEKFLEATRKYVDAVISAGLSNKNVQFAMVEQMVPATNVDRYIRYFNDVRVVVVDRDPRDIYLWEKSKIKWGVIPTKTVEEYVEWFKITRKYSNCQEDVNKVMRLRFEDMIYKYETTTADLVAFIGLEEKDHSNPKSIFNPEVSIHNTNLKSKVAGYEKDIAYIEKELPDYLYDFDGK